MSLHGRELLDAGIARLIRRRLEHQLAVAACSGTVSDTVIECNATYRVDLPK